MFLIYSVEVPLDPIKACAVEKKPKLIALVCIVKPLLQVVRQRLGASL